MFLNDIEAAAYIGVSVRTFKTWRRTKGIPFVVLGSKTVRVSRRDLEEWIAQRQHRIEPLPT